MQVNSKIQPITRIKAPEGGLAAVVGMFDGLHLGHRFLLDALQREAAIRDLQPAVFTFPAHPLSIVNPDIAPKLLSTPAEKLHLLNQAGILPGDIHFMAFNEELRHLAAAEFLSLLHNKYNVRFILRGFNNRFGTERHLSADDYRRIAADCGIELLDAADFTTKIGDEQLPVSSSLIRKAIVEGDMATAKAMLGYPYQLSGHIVEGKQLGRTIGFPTANLQVANPAKLIPANGAYICRALTSDATYRAMVNIGTRPTVDSSNREISIEAYILDFQGDLYNRPLMLEFHHRMRGEIRFSSPHELAEQLKVDKISTEIFTFS
jgi:riboflavin kinase/FMN adenylyltransferase